MRIGGNCGDVILIDDARLFGWRSDYPRLTKIRQFVKTHLPDYKVSVESDLIRIDHLQRQVSYRLHHSKDGWVARN